MKADRVLVPLDGSPLAERALPKALELLGDSPSATLILLRAAQATSLPGIDPYRGVRNFGVLRLAVGSHSLTGRTTGTNAENAKTAGVVQAKSSPPVRRS